MRPRIARRAQSLVAVCASGGGTTKAVTCGFNVSHCDRNLHLTCSVPCDELLLQLSALLTFLTFVRLAIKCRVTVASRFESLFTVNTAPFLRKCGLLFWKVQVTFCRSEMYHCGVIDADYDSQTGGGIMIFVELLR
jgi:hypothetical protein